MTQLTTVDTNNFAAMAKAMGIANEAKAPAKASTLARLRLNHAPIMGTAEVNGKKVNMEVVEGGSYKLEIPDGPTYYATSIKMRPFLQRYMYKKFINKTANTPGRFVKTIMADDLNMDLKDNDGGFNCGKPAGYVKDFKALPEKTQELIKSIKRVRVVLGTVEMVNPTNEKGEPVELDTTPFIWEIDNREAFKEIGNNFTSLAKMQRLPIQHIITASSEERKIPTGASYFVPVSSLDVTETLEIADAEHALFADFMSWVDNYNNYIVNAWSEKVKSASPMDDEDVETVEGFVDIEIDDDEDAA